MDIFNLPQPVLGKDIADIVKNVALAFGESMESHLDQGMLSIRHNGAEVKLHLPCGYDEHATYESVSIYTSGNATTLKEALKLSLYDSVRHASDRSY